VPISYLWYDALSGLGCNKSHQNNFMVNSGGKYDACLAQTDKHWAIFYGVNAMIYAMPIILVLKSARNRSLITD
jgi:hypothetical protein